MSAPPCGYFFWAARERDYLCDSGNDLPLDVTSDEPAASTRWESNVPPSEALRMYNQIVGSSVGASSTSDSRRMEDDTTTEYPGNGTGPSSDVRSSQVADVLAAAETVLGGSSAAASEDGGSTASADDARLCVMDPRDYRFPELAWLRQLEPVPFRFRRGRFLPIRRLLRRVMMTSFLLRAQVHGDEALTHAVRTIQAMGRAARDASATATGSKPAGSNSSGSGNPSSSIASSLLPESLALRDAPLFGGLGMAGSSRVMPDVDVEAAQLALQLLRDHRAGLEAYRALWERRRAVAAQSACIPIASSSSNPCGAEPRLLPTVGQGGGEEGSTIATTITTTPARDATPSELQQWGEVALPVTVRQRLWQVAQDCPVAMRGGSGTTGVHTRVLRLAAWLVERWRWQLPGLLRGLPCRETAVVIGSFLESIAMEEDVWGPHLCVVPAAQARLWEWALRWSAPSLTVHLYSHTAPNRHVIRRYWRPPFIGHAGSAMHIVLTTPATLKEEVRSFQRIRWGLFLQQVHPPLTPCFTMPHPPPEGLPPQVVGQDRWHWEQLQQPPPFMPHQAMNLQCHTRVLATVPPEAHVLLRDETNRRERLARAKRARPPPIQRRNRTPATDPSSLAPATTTTTTTTTTTSSSSSSVGKDEPSTAKASERAEEGEAKSKKAEEDNAGSAEAVESEVVKPQTAEEAMAVLGPSEHDPMEEGNEPSPFPSTAMMFRTMDHPATPAWDVLAFLLLPPTPQQAMAFKSILARPAALGVDPLPRAAEKGKEESKAGESASEKDTTPEGEQGSKGASKGEDPATNWLPSLTQHASSASSVVALLASLLQLPKEDVRHGVRFSSMLARAAEEHIYPKAPDGIEPWDVPPFVCGPAAASVAAFIEAYAFDAGPPLTAILHADPDVARAAMTGRPVPYASIADTEDEEETEKKQQRRDGETEEPAVPLPWDWERSLRERALGTGSGNRTGAAVLALNGTGEQSGGDESDKMIEAWHSARVAFSAKAGWLPPGPGARWVAPSPSVSASSSSSSSATKDKGDFWPGPWDPSLPHDGCTVISFPSERVSLRRVIGLPMRTVAMNGQLPSLLRTSCPASMVLVLWEQGRASPANQLPLPAPEAVGSWRAALDDMRHRIDPPRQASGVFGARGRTAKDAKIARRPRGVKMVPLRSTRGWLGRLPSGLHGLVEPMVGEPLHFGTTLEPDAVQATLAQLSFSSKETDPACEELQFLRSLGEENAPFVHLTDQRFLDARSLQIKWDEEEREWRLVVHCPDLPGLVDGHRLPQKGPLRAYPTNPPPTRTIRHGSVLALGSLCVGFLLPSEPFQDGLLDMVGVGRKGSVAVPESGERGERGEQNMLHGTNVQQKQGDEDDNDEDDEEEDGGGGGEGRAAGEDATDEEEDDEADDNEEEGEGDGQDGQDGKDAAKKGNESQEKGEEEGGKDKKKREGPIRRWGKAPLERGLLDRVSRLWNRAVGRATERPTAIPSLRSTMLVTTPDAKDNDEKTKVEGEAENDSVVKKDTSSPRKRKRNPEGEPGTAPKRPREE